MQLNKMRAAAWMRVVLIGVLALMVAACASIGRPEGGPRDVTPPEFVRSNPAPGSVDVDRNRIDIFFNENVQLDEVQNKLVVSPAQRQQPVARANGRRVTLELRDTLLPNTTYTVDFADAIADLNERNILDGFALDFATGPAIDTLRISGMVFQAENLEPAQGMVVGVYSTDADSAISTLPLERVAKTNQLGQFTIRGLKPGSYSIYAIDDRNRDWHWDRSENVAFASFTIAPHVEPVEVADTLAAADGSDSIAVRTAYHYMPDDILLTWFTEKFKPQYLRDYERTDRRRVTIKLGSPTDTLPQLTVVNGPALGRSLADISVLEARQGLDSLVYWIADTAVCAQDSLLVAARYQKTDSLQQLVWVQDTLKLHVRGVTRQQEKDAAKEWETQLKKREKEQKEHPDSIFAPLQPKVEYAELKLLSASAQHLHKPAEFEANFPISRIDSTMWRLEMAVDTLWKPVEGASLTRDSAHVRRYNLSVPWQEGQKYKFTLDSAAITDIYGHVNKASATDLTVKLSEDYGNIIFDITDIAQIPDSARLVVELLDNSDKPVAQANADDGRVTFTFVDPGTYFARAYVDLNRNGQWDTGEMASRRQPEDVFYFSKKLTLRKNWDIAEEWALLELPVDAQKPDEVKRNKPKNSGKNGHEPDADAYDEEDEFYDESGFGANHFDNENSWGTGAQYNNAHRGSTRRGNTRRNGMRTSDTNRRAR